MIVQNDFAEGYKSGLKTAYSCMEDSLENLAEKAGNTNSQEYIGFHMAIESMKRIIKNAMEKL